MYKELNIPDYTEYVIMYMIIIRLKPGIFSARKVELVGNEKYGFDFHFPWINVVHIRINYEGEESQETTWYFAKIFWYDVSD